MTSAAPAALAFALLSVLGNPPRSVGQASAAPPILEFHGLEVGLPLADLRSRVRGLSGTLTCRPARDPRIDECTGSVRLDPRGRPYALIVSSIHDSAAVLILNGTGTRDSATAWADSIMKVQGRVTPRDRGQQRTWQWVRYRQMLRLIHRRDQPASVLTVTLTDGPLLDNLGAPIEARRQPPP